MRFPKITVCLLALAAGGLGFVGAQRSAKADGFDYFQATYKVQVQYWFFDTDYYYWSTVLETDDYNTATFVYNLLASADADGQLNQVAPNSYWRYIAVDVRMTTEYRYPRYAQPWYSDIMQRSKTLTIAK